MFLGWVGTSLESTSPERNVSRGEYSCAAVPLGQSYDLCLSGSSLGARRNTGQLALRPAEIHGITNTKELKTLRYKQGFSDLCNILLTIYL